MARWTAPLSLLLLAAPSLVLAHGAAHGPGDFHFWQEWSARPGVAVPLIVSTLIYGTGLHAVWRRAGVGRGISRAQAASFGGGLLVLVVALVSPLDAITGSLFWLHMVQHLLLILLAAPLLVLGRPEVALLFAVPARWRQRVGRWENAAARAIVGDADGVGHGPIWVILIGTGVLWAWHVPALYDLAVRVDAVHTAEHTSFVLTAVLFWSTVLRMRARERLGNGLRILYVFAMGLQGSMLGAVITFAARPLYVSHLDSAPQWGLSALADQQLAGLIMWIPPAMLYLGVAAYLFLGWLQGSALVPASLSALERRHRGP